jgi:hypothetical protein
MIQRQMKINTPSDETLHIPFLELLNKLNRPLTPSVGSSWSASSSASKSVTRKSKKPSPKNVTKKRNIWGALGALAMAVGAVGAGLVGYNQYAKPNAVVAQGQAMPPQITQMQNADNNYFLDQLHQPNMDQINWIKEDANPPQQINWIKEDANPPQQINWIKEDANPPQQINWIKEDANPPQQINWTKEYVVDTNHLPPGNHVVEQQGFIQPNEKVDNFPTKKESDEIWENY